MEGYVQGALWKELYIASFVERFKARTLRKSYWEILPVNVTNYLNITFLPTFRW